MARRDLRWTENGGRIFRPLFVWVQGVLKRALDEFLMQLLDEIELGLFGLFDFAGAGQFLVDDVTRSAGGLACRLASASPIV